MVAQAATLGNRARSTLARLWNSGILYAQGNKIAKLKEKVEAIYELFNLQSPGKQQVVAGGNVAGGGIESVVATGSEVATKSIRISGNAEGAAKSRRDREETIAQMATQQDNWDKSEETKMDAHRGGMLEHAQTKWAQKSEKADSRSDLGPRKEMKHEMKWDGGKTSVKHEDKIEKDSDCLLYTSPSPRDGLLSRMPSSA